MTKEEAIQALKELLEPGESVTVERKKLDSLTDDELERVYHGTHKRRLTCDLRSVVMADRRREVARMRERWGAELVTWCEVAQFLGVKVEL